MRILECQAVGWINAKESSRLKEGFGMRLACFNVVPRDKHIEVVKDSPLSLAGLQILVVR